MSDGGTLDWSPLEPTVIPPVRPEYEYMKRIADLLEKLVTAVERLETQKLRDERERREMFARVKRICSNCEVWVLDSDEDPCPKCGKPIF